MHTSSKVKDMIVAVSLAFEATVDYGLNHPELSNDFKKYLDSI